MRRRILQLCVAAIFFAAVSVALPPTIGVASALGTFFINNAEVQGNANLFDGAQIKTSKASSQLFLANGASLILGIDSVGTIYSDHLVLEQGATRTEKMISFSVHAGDYRIAGAQPTSQAVVRWEGTSVQVAALVGSINVFDGSGVLLTRIGAGTAAAFQNGGGSTGGSGSARKNNNNAIRRDAALFLMIAGALAALGLIAASLSGSNSTSR